MIDVVDQLKDAIALQAQAMGASETQTPMGISHTQSVLMVALAEIENLRKRLLETELSEYDMYGIAAVYKDKVDLLTRMLDDERLHVTQLERGFEKALRRLNSTKE